jgi:hypothetical protein
MHDTRAEGTSLNTPSGRRRALREEVVPQGRSSRSRLDCRESHASAAAPRGASLKKQMHLGFRSWRLRAEVAIESLHDHLLDRGALLRDGAIADPRDDIA